MGWALGCGDFARDVGGSLFCFCFAFLGCNWLFWAVAFPSFLGRFCLFFCFLGLGLLYSLVVLLRLLEINAYLSKKKNNDYGQRMEHQNSLYFGSGQRLPA